MTKPAPTLSRSLGKAGVLFLTLSVTTPASSVFVIVPGMLQVAGSGALIAMLLAGLVCVATALIYAELSSAWPVAGGEYVMVARTLGPAAVFAMLGVNVFNNLLFPPVAALGIAAVLGRVWPGLPPIPIALAVMAAATALGVLNVRINAAVTGAFLVIEVVALTVIVILGALHPVRDFAGLILRPQALSGATLVPASASAIGLATSIAIFALNGYGAAVYFSEEMHEAPTRIARAVMIALVATLALEMLPVAAGLVSVPDLRAFVRAADPFGDFVGARGGAFLGTLVAIGIVIAIVNAVIAGVLATARFFYSTARDGSWGRPVDRWLATIHPRAATPIAATLMSGGIGMIACFLPLHLLLLLSGAGLIAIYAGMTAAVVIGRRSGASNHAAYRIPLYPLAPVVTALMLVGIVALNWLDVTEGRPALIATAAQIALSMTYYAIFLRRKAWGTSSNLR